MGTASTAALWNAVHPDVVGRTLPLNARQGRFRTREEAATHFSGAYTRAPESVPLEGTRQWRQAKFELKGALIGNGQNRGADFRLVVEAPECGVGRVTLAR